jgi:hypothetical protein
VLFLGFRTDCKFVLKFGAAAGLLQMCAYAPQECFTETGKQFIKKSVIKIPWNINGLQIQAQKPAQ